MKFMITADYPRLDYEKNLDAIGELNTQ